MSLQEVQQGQAQSLVKKPETMKPISIRPEPRRVFVGPNAPPSIQQQVVQQRTPPQEVTLAQLTRQEAQRRILIAQTIVAPQNTRYQYEGDMRQYTPQEIRSNLIRARDQRQPYFNYLQQQREQQQLQDERYRPMKEEFEKIESAYKVNPVYGFVGELGYGAVTSVKSFGAGVYNIFTGNNIYEPSLFDLAFEPEGAKIWGRHPVFTAGSVYGEALQFFAGGQIAKYGAKGVGIGIKAIPRTNIIPKVVGKLSPSFSKSRFVGFASDALGSISESSVSKNFNLWSKGYRPVTVAVPVASKAAVTTETAMGRITKTNLGYISLRRQFVSPDVYKSAQENFARLLNKTTYDVSFSVKESGRNKFILGSYTKESYGTKGLFRKTLVKKGLYGEYSKPIESFSGKLKYTGSEYKLFSFAPPSKTTMFSAEGFEKIRIGGPKINNVGKIGDVSTEFHVYGGYRGGGIETTMKGMQPELKKPWITYRKNLMNFKSEEATQSLVIRPEIKFNKMRVSYGGSELQKYGRTAINIPIGESSYKIGYLGMYSPRLMKYNKPIQVQKIIPIQMNDKMIDYIQNTRQASRSKNSFADKTISEQAQKIRQVTKLQQITISDPFKPSVPKSVYHGYDYFRSPVSFKPYLWSLPSSEVGGGGYPRQGKNYLVGYRIRRWKTPLLEDYFKGWR